MTRQPAGTKPSGKMSPKPRLLVAVLVTSFVVLLTGWLFRNCLPSKPAPIANAPEHAPARWSSSPEIRVEAATRPESYRFFDQLYPVSDVRDEARNAANEVTRTWLITMPPYGLVRVEEQRRGDHVIRRDAFLAGEVIVTPRPDVSEPALATTFANAGATSWSRVPLSAAWLVRFARPTLDTLPAALANLRRHPELVAEVEGNGLGRGGLLPNDNLFGQQFALRNTEQEGGTLGADVRALEAWDIANSAPGIVVAVLDSGLDFGHPEFSDNIYRDTREVSNGADDDRNGFIDDFRGWDFTNNDNDPSDDHSHGTLVTGIIAAKGNNGAGIAGVVWSVQIMPVKVLDSFNRGTTVNMLAGINYARAKGAKIMNLSLIDYPRSDAVFAAIGAAQSAGILLVVSAGNSGTNNDIAPNYPSSYAQPNLLAVANSTRTDVLNVSSSGSNYGATTVHLAAPGTSILTTARGGSYSQFNGTSAAAPHVTGALALLASRRPDATIFELRQWIFDSVDRVPALAGRCATGGRLNIAAALRLAGTPPPAPVAPIIIAQPTSQTLAYGQAANLSVVATGTPAPTYQWFKDNLALAGATDATLRLGAVEGESAGSYHVIVKSGVLSLRSSSAIIQVTPRAVTGRLINLAIRSQAGTGAATLIVGVTLGGNGTTGTLPILVRGMGPSLARHGVSGILIDPVLAVYSGQMAIAGNDNWAANAQIEAARLQVGAFAFESATSRDAALLTSSLPGAYTVQISGSGGAVGMALSEIYDATPPVDISDVAPRLVNVAARTHVGTDGDLLIAGFTLGGNSSRTFLLRAVGPTLEAFGVTGVLSDPRLELYAGSTVIATNDNWAAAPELVTAATAVGAFTLPETAKDAALLVRLAPGSYTAHVSGVDRSTGIALVEIYDVPE